MTGAASMLDRSSTALLVIDIQDRLATAMARREAVYAKTSLLIEVAAIVGCPVVVTRQYPAGLGDVVEPIAALIADKELEGLDVLRADKVAFDCFAEESFVDALESLGRRQLLIAGMESHICVTQTALSALERGFDAHVSADACCSREDASHDYAMSRLAHAGAAVTLAESAAYELIGRAGTPEFKALLRVVKG